MRNGSSLRKHPQRTVDNGNVQLQVGRPEHVGHDVLQVRHEVLLEHRGHTPVREQHVGELRVVGLEGRSCRR